MALACTVSPTATSAATRSGTRKSTIRLDRSSIRVMAVVDDTRSPTCGSIRPT
jgi:hypothetical protein